MPLFLSHFRGISIDCFHIHSTFIAHNTIEYNKIQQYCQLFTASVFEILLLIMLVKTSKSSKKTVPYGTVSDGGH